jgi:hypothetical protein
LSKDILSAGIGQAGLKAGKDDGPEAGPTGKAALAGLDGLMKTNLLISGSPCPAAKNLDKLKYL